MTTSPGHYGLIGYPLDHSFSKGYFSEKFLKSGLQNHTYENFPLVRLEDFRDLLFSHPELNGLSVTIPYKESIIPFLDELDKSASHVGAVNCIAIRRNKTVGYNTDVYGFTMSIKPFLENHYERALILGTGGASKAVASALKDWGIPFHFVSRSPKGDQQVAYSDLHADSMKHFQLIINTTPLGTYPDIDQAPPIPYEGLTSGHFLYDLVYNPAETLFLKRGKQAGAHTMNGLKMLELQAERSWEIWKSQP